MAEIDQAEAVFDDKRLVQLRKSVGIIRSPNTCCMGFRVGPNYVITAKYAISAIISGVAVPLQLQSLLHPYLELSNPNVFIDFSYERGGVPTDENLKFYFEPEIVYANDELDTVVLKLKPDTKEYPPPLTNFLDIAQLHQSGRNLTLIGYPLASRIFAYMCHLVTLTPHEIAAAKEWSMKHVNVDGFVGIDSPHHVLFHSPHHVLFHSLPGKGSEGSPMLLVNPRDGQACDVLMLLRGYPTWRYDDKYKVKAVEIPPLYLVEQGVSLKSVYDDMKKRDESLWKAIFVGDLKAPEGLMREETKQPVVEEIPSWIIKQGIETKEKAEGSTVETPEQAESMSVQIGKQEFPMSSEDLEQFEQLQKALEAGTDDITVGIVDTIREKGSEILKTQVLKSLSKHLKNKMTLIEKEAKVKIWPGTNLSTGEITFVCFYQGKLETKLTNYFNIDIFYNDIDKVAPEEEMGDEDQNWTMPTEEDALLIQSAIEEHGDRLYSEHSNLQIVCGGPFLIHERQGLEERVPTIILYCLAKGIKPYGENEFPSRLIFDGKSIPVDIREGYFALAFGAKWYPDLHMGISIGEEGKKEYGTIGPFVKLSGSSLGFITCAHVVGTKGTYVVQPSDQDRGRSAQEKHQDNICGRVLRHVRGGSFSIIEDSFTKIVGMDAALVELKGARQGVPVGFTHIPSGVFNAVGIDEATSLQYVDNGNCPISSSVIKCGRTTGLTIGKLVLKGTMLKPLCLEMQDDDTTSYVMKGIDLINGIRPRRKFAEKGDSGSGIYKTDGSKTLSLVGLVLGNMVAKKDNRCAMLPIKYVLRALDITPDELVLENGN